MYENLLDRCSRSSYRSAAMLEILLGAYQAQVVLSMAVREYSFEVNRLTRIQRGPLFDLLFQRAFPTIGVEVPAEVLADAFKETLGKWEASRS